MEAIIIAKQEYDQILVKLDEIREGLHKQVNPSPIQERYLTNAEVCDLLKVSRRTLQRYRDEGRIAFSQVGATIRYKAADAEHAERGYVERVERERDDGPEKEVGAGLIDVDDDGHGCAHKHVLGGLGHSRNEQARDHYHDGGLEPEGHGKGSGARKGTPHESGEACRHYGQLRKAP